MRERMAAAAYGLNNKWEAANAHYAEGMSFAGQRRWEPAARSFERSLELDSECDTARIALGDCLLHLERYEQALATFDYCWSGSAEKSADEVEVPLISQALFGKAVALQLMRRFDEAEAAYERLLALNPKAGEALSNLIAMSMEVYDLTRVQHYTSRLLKIDPNSVAGLQGMAVLALDREDWESVTRLCSRLVELAPDSMEAWHNLRCASARVMEGFGKNQEKSNGSITNSY